MMENKSIVIAVALLLFCTILVAGYVIASDETPVPDEIPVPNETTVSEEPIAPDETKQDNISITILSPEENQTIPSRYLVKGTSTGISDSDINLYVLVYPEGDYWWFQQISMDDTGNWESNAYFGDPSNPSESIGQIFSIAVIATSEELNLEKTDNVPSNVYRVDIKKVVRK